MTTEFLYLISFLTALFTVLVMTPIVKTIGIRSGRVDQPNERKVHERPMVRLGGIAIFLGTMVAIATAFFLGGFADLTGEPRSSLVAILLGAIAFFAVGLLDDLFELSAISRLIMQFVVAAIAWYFGVRIEYLALPFVGAFSVGLLSLPMTLVWLVGMVNAINWIDGLDGLASGVSGIIGTMFFATLLVVNQPLVALLAIALAGVTIGFLRYNFHPAQLFMGDGGSYFIGFTLAGLAVIGLTKEPVPSAVMLPYIVLLVPLLDMTVVVFSRLADGVSPFNPDQRHLHHRLLKTGFSHRNTVLFIYLLTLWSSSFALAIAGLEKGEIAVMVTTLCTGAIAWQFWQQRQIPGTSEE
jgi:UDP-GlcNAc:undecaprenyl-phosphate/decaprenyl-phosphate GlcNAc-1-phosphate transferase